MTDPVPIRQRWSGEPPPPLKKTRTVDELLDELGTHDRDEVAQRAFVLSEEERAILEDAGWRTEQASRPSGVERFFSLSREEQDALVGAETAEDIRQGRVSLRELVQRTRIQGRPGFVTRKPDKKL